MKNIFKKLCIFFVLLSTYIIICSISYVRAVSSDLSNSVLRLHIIANSNSEDDQNLKYAVRDDLLEYMNKLCANCSSKQEAIQLVKENLEAFKEIALNSILEHGYSYNVKINIGEYEFPTKHYGDISLPAGTYDALKVEIGEASGQNWWCVMFPPLCFVDISSGIVDEESKDLLKNDLNTEEFTLISDNSNIGLKFKFKIIELFSQSKMLTASN